ncbi:hypothetical protein FB45DRAFT_896634 [Roridomyces roridus]|uniref:Uncharacterized protein n=1 Tax=Roridomyces roridus TaxID=1738132 RepID=A0AAD7FY88_9AGAR|nr:hypothetical protein FB45DRAFT_896634 [Roridomyces roridus]
MVFQFQEPVRATPGCQLEPQRVRISGSESVNRYTWVLPAVNCRAYPELAVTGLSKTIIRPEYQQLLCGILASLKRQQQLSGKTIGEEMAVDNARANEESSPEPLQLHIDPTYTDINTLKDYPNPFADDNGRLFRPNNALVITGVPGIGKSRFLSLIFHLRILANLPTLFMHEPQSALFYRDGQFGVVNGHLTPTALHTNLSPDTWCLVDSNNDFQSVPRTLILSGFFIVQAASPRKDAFNYEKYLRGSAQFCVMAPWSAEELVDGVKLVERGRENQHLTAEAMRAFHARFGGSAWHAFRYGHDQVGFYQKVRASTFGLDIQQITRLLASPIEDFPVVDDIAHMLFSVLPTNDDDRRLFRVAPPSNGMLDLILARCNSDRDEARRILIEICLGINTASSRLLAAEIDLPSFILAGGRRQP